MIQTTRRRRRLSAKMNSRQKSVWCFLSLLPHVRLQNPVVILQETDHTSNETQSMATHLAVGCRITRVRRAASVQPALDGREAG